MKKLLWLIAIVLIGLGVFLMTNGSYKPEPIAMSALVSGDGIHVFDDVYISFDNGKSHDIGIIFYPGGKVAPEAYAPLMRRLAGYNYATFIAKMPLDLAILSPNEADKIIKDHKDIKHWYIIGHSLGGVIAAEYAFENNLDGLILLAAYPQEKHDLSTKEIRVLSILGSLDGLVNKDKINLKAALLPIDTSYVTIEGGNHAQMGYYGAQKKDITATITTDEQQDIIFKEILKLINPTQ